MIAKGLSGYRIKGLEGKVDSGLIGAWADITNKPNGGNYVFNQNATTQPADFAINTGYLSQLRVANGGWITLNYGGGALVGNIYRDGSQGYVNIDNNGVNAIKFGAGTVLIDNGGLGLAQLSISPSTGLRNGYKYYDSVNHKERTYINGAWQNLVHENSNSHILNQTGIQQAANSNINGYHWARGFITNNDAAEFQLTGAGGTRARLTYSDIDSYVTAYENQRFNIGYPNGNRNAKLHVSGGAIFSTSDTVGYLAAGFSGHHMMHIHQMQGSGYSSINFIASANQTQTWIGLKNTEMADAYSFNIWQGGNYPIVFGTNNTERLRIKNNGVFNMVLPTYGNEAAAVSGGLQTNDLYKTATGEIRIKL